MRPSLHRLGAARDNHELGFGAEGQRRTIEGRFDKFVGVFSSPSAGRRDYFESGSRQRGESSQSARRKRFDNFRPSGQFRLGRRRCVISRSGRSSVLRTAKGPGRVRGCSVVHRDRRQETKERRRGLTQRTNSNHRHHRRLIIDRIFPGRIISSSKDGRAQVAANSSVYTASRLRSLELIPIPNNISKE